LASASRKLFSAVLATLVCSGFSASVFAAGVAQNGTTTLKEMALSPQPSAVAPLISAAQKPVSTHTATKSTVSKKTVKVTTRTKHTPKTTGTALPQPPEAAQTILNELNGMPKVSMNSAPESAFKRAAQAHGLAMSPTEIEQYHEMLLDSAVAAAKLPMPSASAPMVRVSLAPGQIPPILYTASNYVTALTFTDKTGAPWPISNHVIGNVLFFSAVVPSANKENVILITPLHQGVSSNIAVTLKGLSQPIIIPVKASLKTVDYRESIMVDASGPNAKKPIFVAGPSAEVAGPVLTSVLDGISPSGAKAVIATGLPHLMAYKVGNTLYIRAKANLVAPSWTASLSNDGYTAWKLPFSSPLTFMAHGSPVSVSVTH
jgi:intracellular multiplication protein IcmK